jgi:hypothetical protein
MPTKKPLSDNFLPKSDKFYSTSLLAVEALNVDESEFLRTFGFTKMELTLHVANTWDFYQEHERMPTLGELQASSQNLRKLHPGFTSEIYTSPAYKTACYYRGMRANTDGLDERQLMLLSVLTNFARRTSLETKLKQCGVADWEYQAWLRQPEFSKRLHRNATVALKDSAAAADVALASQAAHGNLEAIKYADQKTGRFDPNAKAALDVEFVIKQVLEILMKHITDPELLRRIGGDLSLVMSTAGISPVAQPNNGGRALT